METIEKKRKKESPQIQERWMDFVHCNSCIRRPGPGLSFVLMSCGHILCGNCTKSVCSICQKPAVCTPVDSCMKPEMQMFFKNPKDLASHYMRTLAQVIEFQRGHRARLVKIMRERQQKASKFMGAVRDEIRNRVDAEKAAIKEATILRAELEEGRARLASLQMLLSSKEEELKRLKELPSSPDHKSPYSTKSSYVSSNLPLMASTPTNPRHRSFEAPNALFKSGGSQSPILAGDPITTPVMLGLNSRRHTKFIPLFDPHSFRRSSSAGTAIRHKGFFGVQCMEK